jgi:hypothetical protein
MNEHQHKKGALNQKNKPFKQKNETKSINKGKISNLKEKNFKNNLELNKEGRKIRMKQIQINKRKIILEQKRIGSSGGPPKIVVI